MGQSYQPYLRTSIVRDNKYPTSLVTNGYLVQLLALVGTNFFQLYPCVFISVGHSSFGLARRRSINSLGP
ncbi:transmembrane protein, putative [Medicago truncatula]|uniref:Transmembrane protein, putative n=1 Tax=Medicago truncatula TaxID=3880 RepID=A0A072ULC0_MEDTR|nr:transmembrane protein, putative [Medicago truncatula]